MSLAALGPCQVQVDRLSGVSAASPAIEQDNSDCFVPSGEAHCRCFETALLPDLGQPHVYAVPQNDETIQSAVTRRAWSSNTIDIELPVSSKPFIGYRLLRKSRYEHQPTTEDDRSELSRVRLN